MWQEQLDVFWDGDRALLFGFFDSEGDNPRLKHSPDLTIISSRRPDFSGETFFVDRLDAMRWRAGACLVAAPPGHRHLALLAPDGAELRLSLEENEGATPGEWRLALALAPDAAASDAPAIRRLSCPAQNDFARFAREQFTLAGARLVWACGQKRLAARGEDAKRVLRIWPSSQLYPPTRVRLAAEGLDYPPDGGFEDRREAPFAVMEQWLREDGAPRPVLRLRLFDPVDETAQALSRISVALVMHQRRRLREWANEQREADEPGVAPLCFEDIRQATEQLGEFPDAVWSHEPIVAYNLLKLATAPEDAPLDGLTIRRSHFGGAPYPGSAGITMELDFYGAALGDDIALVCLRPELGEAWILPRAPGNDPNIRLFRVEAEGVRPRRLTEDDPLAAEIFRFVSDCDNELSTSASRATLDRAAGLQARREKFAQALNAVLTRLDYQGGFESNGVWEPLTPLLLSNFVALLKQADPAGRALAARLGGYRAYRLDPSLFAALVLHPQWGESSAGALKAPAQAPLVNRLVQHCDAEGLVPPQASVAEQARAFDRLVDAPDPRKLRAARLTLDDEGDSDPLAVAEKLTDRAAIEEAAAFYEAQGDAQAAGALRDYLDRQAQGLFVSLTKAAALPALLSKFQSAATEAAARAERIKTQEPTLTPQPTQKPKGILATMKGFFGAGR